MSERQAEQSAAGATAAKETKKTDAQEVEQTVESQVIIFDGNKILRVDNDGKFKLKITGEDVTGDHDKPAAHKVKGKLKNNRINVSSEDNKREHVGELLFDKFYIGKKFVNSDELDQQEGVWVGTKTP